MPQLVCPICSVEFYRKPSQVKRCKTSYCSIACAASSRRNGKMVNCHECGKSVYRAKQYLDKYNHFFCSKRCSIEWKNTEFVGEKHGNWRHGKFAYKNILKREDVEVACLLCSITDTKVLVAHHVDEDRSNNTPENLAWLCRNCHHLVHYYSEAKAEFKKKHYA